MNAAELLAGLSARGFTVRAQDGKLWIIPSRDLTDADRAAIVRFKPALLAELSGHPAYSPESGWPPTPPECRATGADTCPVPPFCAECPDKYLACPEHGDVRPIVQWQTISDGRRQLRAECPHCGKWLKFVEQTDYWASVAKAVSPPIVAAVELRRRVTRAMVAKWGYSPEQAIVATADWDPAELAVWLEEKAYENV